MSYQANDPKKQCTEKKKVSPRPPRHHAEGSDERPPTPKNGGLATGSAGLAVRELYSLEKKLAASDDLRKELEATIDDIRASAQL